MIVATSVMFEKAREEAPCEAALVSTDGALSRLAVGKLAEGVASGGSTCGAGRKSTCHPWRLIRARRPSLSVADQLHHRHLQGGGKTADVVEATPDVRARRR